MRCPARGRRWPAARLTPSGLRLPARAALGVLGALIALAGPARGLEVLGTRVTLDPAGEAWVGQYVAVDVDVLTDEVVAAAPSMELPPVAGGVLLRVGSQGVRASETVDGRVVQVFRYGCALFAHRAGTIELPAIRLRFPEGEGAPGPVETNPVTLEAAMPPGAENLATIVSAPSVEITEGWSPDPRAEGLDVKVGDAFTRTVTLEAPEVLGMGFPPLPVPEVDGLGIYPRAPVVEDRENRGEFTGRRVETTVFVCERAGTATLPGLVIPWFDTGARAVRRFTIDPVEFNVQPNPALASAPDGTRVGAGDASAAAWNPWWIAGPAVLFVALGGLLRRFGPAVEATLERRRVRRAESEAAAFRALAGAARANDPLATCAALSRWAGRLGRETGRPATATPRTLAHGSDAGDALADELDLLERTLFAPAASPTTAEGRAEHPVAWLRGPALLAAVRRVRRASLRRHRPGSRAVLPLPLPAAVHLAPLNDPEEPSRGDEQGSRPTPPGC